MAPKAWVSLPFLGGSDATGGPKQHRTKRPLQRKVAPGNGALKEELELQKPAEGAKHMAEEDIIADYNSPIHMWVISTLFPLIAGTFGPMASMFNVCAIATNWRVVVNPATAHGGFILDPHWLLAVNAVSLTIAIVANVSLLGQMTSRLKYNISGPITIVGFFFSGLVDVILVAVASSILPLHEYGPDATYSEAFYYATFAGALYIILACLLSVTAWGIWFGGYSTEFKLSLAQRSLMLQTIMFLTYVLAAGAVYAQIETWAFLDGVYFTIVTLFTIGFGDLVPKTHLGRSLFFPFAVGGILFVGVIIANIRTVILESGAVKISNRLIEKARTRAIKYGEPDDGIYAVRGLTGVKRHDTNAETEYQRRRNEFKLMRAIQREAALTNRLVSLAFAMTAFCILWFIGAVAFWKAESLSVGGENWSYFESLYFTFVAQLTIGYGDFEPQSNSAKPVFVFWALIALPTLTVLIGAVGDAVSEVVTWYTTWVGEHAEALYQIFVALYEPNNSARAKIKALIRDPDRHKDPEDIDPDDLGFHNISNIDDKHVVPVDVKLDNFSRMQKEKFEEKYKPYLAMRAAQEVTKHLDETPPRKYNFREWSWLLKLIGEDESTDSGHRKVGEPLPEGHEIVEPIRDGKHQVWSWIGQESPLMNLDAGSEPKWILKRLLKVVEQELQARAERHIERDVGPIIRHTGEKSESSESDSQEEIT